jgi:adenylate cyclase
MIGRAAERTMVEQVFARAAAGIPQIALITGAPGSGRTTVLRYLAAYAACQAGQVFRVRCAPVGTRSTHGTLGDILTGLLKVSESASPVEMEKAVRAGTAGLGDPQRHAALLGSILGLDIPHRCTATLSPGALANAQFAALDDLLAKEASRLPLALTIDDVHWADGGLVEWLETFRERMALATVRFPILIACTALDGSIDLRSQGSVPECHTIPVGTLTMSEAVEIAGNWLGCKVATLPPDGRMLVKRVLDQAKGNPSYIEETLAALVENGVLRRSETGASWEAAEDAGSLALPEWIAHAVESRLAKLPDRLKDSIRLAAATRPSMVRDVLRHASGDGADDALAELIRLKLLVETGTGSVHLATEGLRNAAFASASARQREQLHAKVGEAIEQVADAAPARFVADLARHFVEAGDAGRAFKYLVLAGDRALATNLPVQARAAYREALGWVGRLAGTDAFGTQIDKLHLQIAVAEIQQGLFDEALSSLAMVRRRSAAAARTMALAHIRTGRLQEAHDAALKARDFARTDDLETAHAEAAVADILRRMGRYDEALVLAESAKTRFEWLDAQSELALAHGVAGLCHHRLGRHEEALLAHSEALRLREAAGDLEGMANSLNNLGMVEAGLARFEEAEKDYDRALELFCRIGNRPGAAMALCNLGDLCLKRGDDARAEKHLQDARNLAEEMGDLPEEITACANLAEVYLVRSQNQAALKLLDHCVGLVVRAGQREFLPEIHAGRGRAYRQDGDRWSAIRAYEEAMMAAEAVGNTRLASKIKAEVEVLRGSLRA